MVPIPVTPGQLHLDSYLTNLSVSFTQSQDMFVASKVFPNVPVNHQSDKYAIYPKGYFLRDEYRPRPLGGRPAQATYSVTSGTYFCEEWGLEHKIDDRVRANADQPLDPDRAGMRLLMSQGLIRQDRMWASQYFKTGVWGLDLTGEASSPSTNQFLQFDQSGSDPIGYFDQQVETIGSATGYPPNTLVLGPDVYRVLKNHSAVTDRIKYTQRGIVTADILAELFDVEQVLVARGVYNSAKEGQTDSIGYILDKKSALLVYAAPDPGIDTPSAGYTFSWTNLLPGASQQGAVIERGREELAHSDVLQGRMAFDMEVVAPELGTFFTACVG